MSGDAHVRICESPRAQFPRATRLYLKIDGRMVYLWRAVGLLKAASKPSS